MLPNLDLVVGSAVGLAVSSAAGFAVVLAVGLAVGFERPTGRSTQTGWINQPNQAKKRAHAQIYLAESADPIGTNASR